MAIEFVLTLLPLFLPFVLKCLISLIFIILYPDQMEWGHIKFGVDPVGISIGIGCDTSCLHNIL